MHLALRQMTRMLFRRVPVDDVLLFPLPDIDVSSLVTTRSDAMGTQEDNV